jgi:mono/diheme cytochrome c family protein
VAVAKKLLRMRIREGNLRKTSRGKLDAMAFLHSARLAGTLGIRTFAISLAFFIPVAALLMISAAGCRRLTAQQAEGKHLYEVRCAHCHRDNDLGLKKVPPDLHNVFRRATLPSGAPATDAQVARVVLEGKGMMPSFAGRFNDEQMAALLAYLHTGLR